MSKTINESEGNSFEEKSLLLEQIQGLKARVKDAIASKSTALAPSFGAEYLGLLRGAMVCAVHDRYLSHEVIALKAQTNLYPQKVPKDDPLLQLRWFNNAISQMETLVNKLPPATLSLSQIGLHPRVIEVAGKLLNDGHYAQAVFEVFKALEEYVRDKSGVEDKYGKTLMAHVLNEKSPILKIKPSHPKTSNDEQEGFKLIFMGSIQAIKNPKSHRTLKLNSKSRALSYLAFASLLFEIVDDATIDASSTGKL